MPIPGGNHTIVGQRCAQAPQQLFALMLSIQSVKPFAVKTNVCILREIFLEETISTVRFGDKFIPLQIPSNIQRVLNAVRQLGFQHGFEFQLFGFAHSRNTLCKHIKRVNFIHTVKHIRGDLRNR